MKTILGLLSVLSILSGCAEAPVGSKKNPLKIFFIPYIEQQTIVTHTDALVKYLEKSLSQKMLGQDEGFHIKSSIPVSYVGVVEAFGTKRADVAAMTTFSYLLTRDIKKYPVEAFLTVDRDRDGKFYKGAIIARADSKIKSIKDLEGKKFAFSDPSSTSGFILPSKLFKDQGIKLSETVFAGRHDTVVSMVFQKQVDAGAIYYSMPEIKIVNGKKVELIRDARSMVMTQIPDVEDKIKIIGFTPEVPNEPWILRSNLFADPAQQAKFKAAIRDSIIEFSKSPAGKDLMEILVRAERLVPAEDSDYDGIRKVVTELQVNMSDFVK